LKIAFTAIICSKFSIKYFSELTSPRLTDRKLAYQWTSVQLLITGKTLGFYYKDGCELNKYVQVKSRLTVFPYVWKMF